MHMQGVDQAGSEETVPQVKLEQMTNVEPSFVLYALLLDPGCCLRAHITLIELVEPEEKNISLLHGVGFGGPRNRSVLNV